MSGPGGPVQLRDYSPIEDQAALALCQEMQDKIQDGQCRLVDLLEPRIGGKPREPVTLAERKADGTWWTRNYIGLFQLGEEQVVITSRFDQRDGPGRLVKPFFLYYLLETCWDTALLSLETLGSTYERNMFDLLLVAKLSVQLQRAWKKGTLRQYQTFRHNDSRVRGPIDVPRHIRENLGQNTGRIAYRTRAYSPDNPYNVLILQAVDTAERRYPALLNRLCRRLPEFQSALRTLRQEAPNWAGVRREAVLRHTAKRIVNPVYRDYEPVRTAARAILRRLGADPQGKSRCGSVVTGVFLDMDALWERFLEKELFRGTQAAAQKQAAILDGCLNVIPDFLWREKGMVMDAKNRPAWGRTLDSGPWGEDVRDDAYQVLTYMLALDCWDGGVVFPDRDHGPQVPQCRPVGGRRFWRVPVYIPQAEDYPSFAHQMKAETERLRRTDPVCGLLE